MSSAAQRSESDAEEEVYLSPDAEAIVMATIEMGSQSYDAMVDRVADAVEALPRPRQSIVMREFAHLGMRNALHMKNRHYQRRQAARPVPGDEETGDDTLSYAATRTPPTHRAPARSTGAITQIYAGILGMEISVRADGRAVKKFGDLTKEELMGMEGEQEALEKGHRQKRKWLHNTARRMRRGQTVHEAMSARQAKQIYDRAYAG